MEREKGFEETRKYSPNYATTRCFPEIQRYSQAVRAEVPVGLRRAEMG